VVGRSVLLGLLLNASGVGDHHQRAALQGQKLYIGKGFQKMEPTGMDAKLANPAACSRMHRE
jgi:hypothetical protein